MSVSSSVNDIDEVTKQIKITIPPETITKEVETALSNYAKQTKIKGFRPGKAPKQLVEKLHGKRVHMEVAHKLISSSLNDLIKERNIDIIGSPEIDVDSIEEGKEIAFTANVSIYPSPEVTDFDSFAVKVPKREVTEERIEQVVNELRERSAKVEPVEGRTSAQEGDIVQGRLTIDVEGEEPGRPEPTTIEVGMQEELPDRGTAFVGAVIGETTEIQAPVPDKHPVPHMRGKAATYRLTVERILEKKLSEVTDEFVQTLEIDGAKSVAELRDWARDRLAENDEREKKGDVQAAILDQLVERNVFKVPQILIDDEIRGLIARSGLVDAQKIDLSKLPVEAFRERMGESAEKRVKTAILVDQLARQQSLKVEEADLDKAAQGIAENNGITKEEVMKYFRDTNRLNTFVVEVSRNKVLELLMAKTEVTEE